MLPKSYEFFFPIPSLLAKQNVFIPSFPYIHSLAVHSTSILQHTSALQRYRNYVITSIPRSCDVSLVPSKIRIPRSPDNMILR